MATYFIGDVHGCRTELEALLEALGAGEDDRVYLTGDVFDRGPDPVGVFDLIQERGLLSIQSNHEWHLGRVMKLYQETGDWPGTELYVLECLNAFLHRSEEFLAFLGDLPMYRRGEDWILVHAGIHPTEGIPGTTMEMALNMRRFPMKDRRAPLWHHQYRAGPLVIFGHNARKEPVLHRVDGKLLAAGLDTGCVYGGALTALHLEEERLVQVPAARDYRKR